MNVRIPLRALAAAVALVTLPSLAHAFADCPANHVADGYTCTEQTGAGKTGGYFRVTFPSDWDGDLVIINHGFDLNDKHRRPHESCSAVQTLHCEQDSDCGGGQFCNEISYLGVDEVLLPMGKAVAASTYTDSGWATFHSSKDITDIIKYVKKSSGFGDQLKRVIITGFSGGGAVTADATLKLKIDGAVPLCAAAAGGLPTWDVAHEVRLAYDYVCNGVPGGSFAGFASDQGKANSSDSNNDAIGVAVKVDTCFGVLGIVAGDGHQAERFAKFLALTQFTGDAGHGGNGVNVASAIGFPVLGLGDMEFDKKRLNSKRIGWNDTLDYSTLGTDPMLAADYQTNVERLTKGKGRSGLKKFHVDFTKGKGKKVAYPILSMAGANDWLVIPEFNRVYGDALNLAAKPFTQTWIDTYGHCVFTEQEVTAVFTKYFQWLGPVGGPNGAQPTATDVSNACLALPGGVQGDTCNFNLAFSPGAIYDRIPQRLDWPPAAKAPLP